MIRSKMQETSFANNEIFKCLVFEENYVFFEEENPQTKLIGRTRYNITGIGNLMDIPKVCSLMKNVGILK